MDKKASYIFPTFTILLLVRLRVLIYFKSMSYEKIAKEAGFSPSWLARKMMIQRDSPAARPLKVDDIETMLRIMGEPPEILTRPILGPVGGDFLRWIQDNGGRCAPRDMGRWFKKPERLAKALAVQGLVSYTPPDAQGDVFVCITPYGESILMELAALGNKLNS